MSFAGSKDLGVDIAATDDTAKHVLGTRVGTNDGKEFQYILAGGAITANAPVKIATGFSATVSGNAGRVDGVAPVAIASGDYGWIQRKGVCSVDAATDVDAGDYVTGISDASGRVIEAVAVAEGGAATHAVGSLRIIGVGLVNEAANVATIELYGN